MRRNTGDLNVAYFRKWQEIYKGDTAVFDYQLMWNHHIDLGYYSVASLISRDIKDLRRLGLNGMISCQLLRSAFPNGLPQYTMAKTLWNKELSFNELLKLHSLKTGRMIELSALLGCIAAGYSKDSKEACAVCAYARNIGLAFQAIDDLLDRIGDEAVVGKTLCSDADNQKTTFLSFYDIEGVRDYAKSLTDSAISEISAIEGSELLCELALYLLERDN